MIHVSSKRSSVLPWAVSAFALASSIGPQSPSGPDGSAGQDPDVVRCRGLEVVDDQGRVIASIGKSLGGWGVLQTFGADGSPLVVLGGLGSSDPQATLTSGAVMTYYPSGAVSAALGPDPDGRFGMFLTDPEHPDEFMAMITGDGRKKGGALLHLGRSPGSEIQVASDVDGTGRPSVLLAKDGRPLAVMSALDLPDSPPAKQGVFEAWNPNAIVWTTNR